MSLSWERGFKSNSGLDYLTFLPNLMSIKILRCKFLKINILIKRPPNNRDGQAMLIGYSNTYIASTVSAKLSQYLRFVHPHRYTADIPTTIYSSYYCA